MTSTFHQLAEKIRKGLSRLPFLARGLALVWSAARGWTIAWAFLLVLQGVLPVASVYLTKWLVDSIVVVIEEGTFESLVPSLWLIAAFFVVLLLKELLRSLTGLVRTEQSERLMDHVSAMIHEKAAEIDLSYYDLPQYYDQLHRARMGIASRSLALLEGLGSLLQNGITLAAMVLVLAPYGLWLPLALLVSTLPAFAVVLQHRLRYQRWYIENTERERRASYYDLLITQREAVPELRILRLSSHFQDAYRQLRNILRQERLSLMKDQSLAEMVAGLAALLVTGLTMAWMIWRTLNGAFTLGDLALFYQAFNQGQGLMRTLMENLGDIYSNSYFLADLFEFLVLEPVVRDPEAPQPFPGSLRQGISFQDVSFAYPGGSRKALDGFNLELQAGKIAAIVGANGAGKSTLVKLLCRFYDPQSGSIAFDGVNLKEFAQADLRRHMTVLLQQPVNYSATARENISLGRLEDPPEMAEIEQAARLAGADQPVERLPQKYDTLLGRWFTGGTELSVGEWQRLALARAFVRQAPVMILDEPTSSMDPWAEADWLERFRQLAAGRTAVLITHRFTTAAYADRIYVMDQGRIVESGRHHELLQSGGRYASSWREQMRRWAETETLE